MQKIRTKGYPELQFLVHPLNLIESFGHTLLCLDTNHFVRTLCPDTICFVQTLAGNSFLCVDSVSTIIWTLYCWALFRVLTPRPPVATGIYVFARLAGAGAYELAVTVQSFALVSRVYMAVAGVAEHKVIDLTKDESDSQECDLCCNCKSLHDFAHVPAACTHSEVCLECMEAHVSTQIFTSNKSLVRPSSSLAPCNHSRVLSPTSLRRTRFPAPWLGKGAARCYRSRTFSAWQNRLSSLRGMRQSP